MGDCKLTRQQNLGVCIQCMVYICEPYRVWGVASVTSIIKLYSCSCNNSEAILCDNASKSWLFVMCFVKKYHAVYITIRINNYNEWLNKCLDIFVFSLKSRTSLSSSFNLFCSNFKTFYFCSYAGWLIYVPICNKYSLNIYFTNPTIEDCDESNGDDYEDDINDKDDEDNDDSDDGDILTMTTTINGMTN